MFHRRSRTKFRQEIILKIRDTLVKLVDMWRRGRRPESVNTQRLKSNGINGKNSESYLQPDDDHFINFQNQLASMGLTLRDIPGDGNCLFRALGDQLEGHGRNHFQHRMDTVRFMIKNRKDFEPFISDEMPYEKYLDNLARPGSYAGQDALVAFARLHKVNIVIHQLASPIWQIEGGSAGCGELHLSYHNGEHYSSVRLREDYSESPANIRLSVSKKAFLQCTQRAVVSNGAKDNARVVVLGANNANNKHLSESFAASNCGSGKLEDMQKRKFLAAFLDSATEDDVDSGAEFVGINRSSVVASSGAEESGVGEQLGVNFAMVQYVMDNTGCTDEILIEEVLIANALNVELAIDHLLNLLFEPTTSEITDSSDLVVDQESAKTCNDGKRAKGQSVKNSGQGDTKGGAKPKTPQKKLSNRERKALYQREKLEKKEERRQQQKVFEEEQRIENQNIVVTTDKLNYLTL